MYEGTLIQPLLYVEHNIPQVVDTLVDTPVDRQELNMCPGAQPSAGVSRQLATRGIVRSYKKLLHYYFNEMR